MPDYVYCPVYQCRNCRETILYSQDQLEVPNAKQWGKLHVCRQNEQSGFQSLGVTELVGYERYKKSA